MGILASNVVISATGVCIANAYVAMARNEVRMYPQGANTFVVNTSYDIWNSHLARVQGKAPVERRVLRYDYSGNSTPVTMYDVAYARIKGIFPGCVDQL